MSVKDRLDDAMILVKQGRWEGALCLTLIAVAATSRKRFPRETGMTDGQAFEKYLDEDLWRHVGLGGFRGAKGVITITHRGKEFSLEHILYRHFRCELVHEASLPSDIVFDANSMDELSIRSGDGTGAVPLILSTLWLQALVTTVVCAKENANLFPITDAETGKT